MSTLTALSDHGENLPMKILVTGGCGFVGSAFVRMLVRGCGHEVANIDKLTYAASPEALETVAADPRYRLIHADICDRAAVAKVLAGFRPDAVVHLAAESHVDRSIDAPEAFVTTNVLGTCTMLEAARCTTASGVRHLPRLRRGRSYQRKSADSAAHCYNPVLPGSRRRSACRCSRLHARARESRARKPSR